MILVDNIQNKRIRDEAFDHPCLGCGAKPDQGCIRNGVEMPLTDYHPARIAALRPCPTCSAEPYRGCTKDGVEMPLVEAIHITRIVDVFARHRGRHDGDGTPIIEQVTAEEWEG